MCCSSWLLQEGMANGRLVPRYTPTNPAAAGEGKLVLGQHKGTSAPSSAAPALCTSCAHPPISLSVYMCCWLAAKRAVFEAMAAKHGVAVDALALAVVMAQPFKPMVLSGASTEEQLRWAQGTGVQLCSICAGQEGPASWLCTLSFHSLTRAVGKRGIVMPVTQKHEFKQEHNLVLLQVECPSHGAGAQAVCRGRVGPACTAEAGPCRVLGRTSSTGLELSPEPFS